MTFEHLTNPPRIVDLPYVKARLWRWAGWCLGARYSGGEVSITGRLIDGLKSNVCPGWLDDVAAGRAHDPHCPQCGGRGRLRLALRSRPRLRRIACSICDAHGIFFGDWCYRCQGTREITITELQVNPATIPGTRHVGGDLPNDAASAAIDEMVTGWRAHDETVWCHRVVVAEYLWHGYVEMKLRRLRVTQKTKADRMKVSLSFYEKRLREGHRRVESLLREKNL
jgi:hypothetical protein